MGQVDPDTDNGAVALGTTSLIIGVIAPVWIGIAWVSGFFHVLIHWEPPRMWTFYSGTGFAFVGLLLGIVALYANSSNKTQPISGIVLNILSLVAGVVSIFWWIFES